MTAPYRSYAELQAELDAVISVLWRAADRLTYNPDGTGAPLVGYPFGSVAEMAAAVLSRLVDPPAAPAPLTGDALDAIAARAEASRTHELKTWPEYYSRILTGEKTFELRYDDRAFRAGDILHLREWLPVDKSYTGRDMQVEVTYILSGFGLQPGWVVMGFSQPALVAECRRLRAEVDAAKAKAAKEAGDSITLAFEVGRLRSELEAAYSLMGITLKVARELRKCLVWAFRVVKRMHYISDGDDHKVTQRVLDETRNIDNPTDPFKYIPESNGTVRGEMKFYDEAEQ